ncbi:MAG TPA: anti-sigma factor [Stellaceae bacterium]|nr:anti-sigma factor [Stellaceae bacterium]
MRYDTPELRERLAAEYVVGTMPTLVRRRFERLMASDAALRREVDDWLARFHPLDQATDAVEPPARVWRSVERQLDLAPAPAPQQLGWFASLAFWRATAFAAAALAAAAIIYVAVGTSPVRTATVVAILSDDKGAPGWVALAGGHDSDIAVAPIRKVALDAAHAFELWAIAGGKPHSLGLLTPEPDRPLLVAASQVPASAVLAISLEPAGGSPSGLPTGPVEYKGAVLAR